MSLLPLPRLSSPPALHSTDTHLNRKIASFFSGEASFSNCRCRKQAWSALGRRACIPLACRAAAGAAGRRGTALRPHLQHSAARQGAAQQPPRRCSTARRCTAHQCTGALHLHGTARHSTHRQLVAVAHAAGDGGLRPARGDDAERVWCTCQVGSAKEVGSAGGTAKNPAQWQAGAARTSTPWRAGQSSAPHTPGPSRPGSPWRRQQRSLKQDPRAGRQPGGSARTFSPELSPPNSGSPWRRSMSVVAPLNWP